MLTHVIRKLQLAYNMKLHMSPPPLLVQTTYAELLDRCRATAFHDDFPQDGTFVSKTIRNKRYWYFQQSSEAGRQQKYVGPETPELLEQISQHKQIRDDERERRALVSTLIRSFALPRPIPEIGDIVAALAKAGVFRLRGVLVGTVAYQTYSSTLGTRLPLTNQQTGDVDIAQFKNISVAVGDRTPPILDVLKDVDKTFRPVPHIHDQRNVTSYLAKGGLRVDFLTPTEGPDTDAPQPPPAFQTDAEPLRFLDFLIHDPEPAVVLRGAGIYVLVPSPQRFAVHKLIVSRRRREGAAKRDKDIHQAAALLEVLAEKWPHELRLAWDEANKRGKTWRQLLAEGLGQMPATTRDVVLKVVGGRRSIIPGLDLTFNNSVPRYDGHHHAVAFAGEALGSRVSCAISREAIDDYFRATGLSNKGRLEKFHEKRSMFEQMAREMYLHWPVEEPETVLIKTTDVPKLQQAIAKLEHTK
jgi:hypothetical protein